MKIHAELFPEIRVDESVLYCYPSRIGNTYEPSVDRILQNEVLIPEQELVVCCEKKQSSISALPKANSYRSLIKSVITDIRSKHQMINFGESVIYDARFVFNGNMAHIVQHHLSTLGYVMHKCGFDCNNILVVIAANSSRLAIDSFNLAGFEVIQTNAPVAGNIISVENSFENFFHLLPYVKHIDIGTRWVADTPCKVFISRRKTRKITNEEDISSLLWGYGYERVYFESLSIQEQWSIMRSATHLVGVHGAALGCMAFSSGRPVPSPIKLCELFGSGFVVNVFRKYVAVLGGSWVGCRGQITPEVVRDVDRDGLMKSHAYDDFKLSPAALELALENIEDVVA